MLKYIPVLFLIPYLFFVTEARAQKTDVTGVITAGPTVSLISIAVNDFQMDESLVTEADSLFSSNLKNYLIDDLTFTLYFNVVEPDSAFIVDFAKGQMKLDDWIFLEARMLIKGRLNKHEGLYTMGLEVIDIHRNTMIYNNEFLGSEQNCRTMAHRMAADLLQNLTGEKGVFDSKIAYSSQVRGSRDIYICDFDGYNAVKLTDDTHIDQMPAWSHAGDRIYFTSDRRNNHDLYCYIFEKNEVYTISNREGLNFAAAPSPDGKYIAATLSLPGNSEIYLLDSSGRIMRRLTHSWAIDTSPTWSPNSREIAFISDRAGNPQLYVTEVDGINTRRLTYYGDYIADPVWSPRGDYIAYCSREVGQFHIYIVDITGQNAYKLTEIASNEAPSWSPDGLHIVYSSNIDGPYSLWIMNFDGSGKRKLNLRGNCKSPDWSVNLR
ncbi:MAG: Tol-Pal system beta propeller repeat protein TolB [candidate division Zixibacteria bacterium]|nr:Tol-Pal system beta propeller repeat protein TolB [candidate division Zixibacteria bacterium]